MAEITKRPLRDLTPDPANARLHDPRNIEAIKASLQRFGQQKPIVVRPDGMVVAGNGTLAAAKALGWSEIDTVTTTLTGSEIMAFAVADNRTAELASWDDRALAATLTALNLEDGTYLSDVGYTEQELAMIMGGLQSGEVIEDNAPLPPDEATARRGDIWQLGNHRLMCGDSASVEDLDMLLAGAPIHLANCDPPYGVRVEPRSNNAIAAGLSSFAGTKHHQKFDVERHPAKTKGTTRQMRAKDRPLANDFVTDEAFDGMLDAWFGNIARVLLPGHGFYIWGGYANCGNYPPVLKRWELYFSQAVIWVKEHPVLTRKDFMGNHEWCFYGWRLGAAHRYFGPANATDVWSVKKVNPQSMVHLTEKPVELAARAMSYSSLPGEHVLDLFGGSGSTLIAAEQTDRRAYLMELDPPYCDVIVQRWESLTGKKAERIKMGEVTPEKTPEQESSGVK